MRTTITSDWLNGLYTYHQGGQQIAPWSKLIKMYEGEYDTKEFNQGWQRAKDDSHGMNIILRIFFGKKMKLTYSPVTGELVV